MHLYICLLLVSIETALSSKKVPKLEDCGKAGEYIKKFQNQGCSSAPGSLTKSFEDLLKQYIKKSDGFIMTPSPELLQVACYASSNPNLREGCDLKKILFNHGRDRNSRMPDLAKLIKKKLEKFAQKIEGMITFSIACLQKKDNNVVCIIQFQPDLQKLEGKEKGKKKGKVKGKGKDKEETGGGSPHASSRGGGKVDPDPKREQHQQSSSGGPVKDKEVDSSPTAELGEHGPTRMGNSSSGQGEPGSSGLDGLSGQDPNRGKEGGPDAASRGRETVDPDSETEQHQQGSSGGPAKDKEVLDSSPTGELGEHGSSKMGNSSSGPGEPGSPGLDNLSGQDPKGEGESQPLAS